MLHRSPIKIRMIAFELRINKIPETFSGDRVIVIFLPNGIIRSLHPVLPYTIRAPSQPAHAGTLLLGIRKSKPQVKYRLIHERIIKPTSTGRPVQQNSIHRQQAGRGHTPLDRIDPTPIMGTENSIFPIHPDRIAGKLHFHTHRQRAICQRDFHSFFSLLDTGNRCICLTKSDSNIIGRKRHQRIVILKHGRPLLFRNGTGYFTLQVITGIAYGPRPITNTFSIRPESFKFQNIGFPKTGRHLHTCISRFTGTQRRQTNFAGIDTAR